jgi:hypothetical protein
MAKSTDKSCAPAAKRAVHAHERNMHRGKPLTKLGKSGRSRSK